jgi:hypothetical protein
MDNRCFNTYNTTKMTGSDYITAKKRRTLFKASRTIAIGNSNIPAGYLVKQNNAIYNGPIYINPNTSTSTSNGCLIGAKSYELLYDVIKGKPVDISHFDNIINPASSNASWSGSIMTTAQKSAISNMPSTYSNSVMDTMYYLPSQNFLIYPKSLNDETNDVFPGMIVDPTNTLFSPVCNNGNNYIQNVDLIINKNTLTDKQIALFLSNNTTLDSGVFPYPVNFNNTTC